MLRDPGGDSTNFPGAKGGKGQTPFSRFESIEGSDPAQVRGVEGAPARSRQRGWVGMIVLLLALAIVAWLSKDALKQYAFMAPATTNVKTEAASPGERARAPAAIDASGATVESAAPTPTAPMDRARGLESAVKRQEAQRGGGN